MFVNVKGIQTYVVLGVTLLLSGSLLVSSWADEREIISFLPRNNEKHLIYLMSIRGEILQKLTTGPGVLGSFTWSPDGGSVVYSSRQNGNPDIYVVDLKKKTHRQLTFHDSRDLWPAWSPNGKWIAFVSERAGDRDIYRMDVNGENIKRLTNQGGCNKPAWAPDSQWIAFNSTLGEGVAIDNFLSLMTAEGRGIRRLTDTSQPGCAWSPDGKEIAFVPPVDVVGGIALFSVDKDGKNMRRLTQLYKGLVLIFHPIWSPCGKSIAYLFRQIPEEFLERGRGPVDEVFANSVICIANTAEGGEGEPFEATRGLVSGGGLEWVPEGFLSVSPSAEKQTTLWGQLKQTDK